MTTVYYFSGSGNSLAVAKDVAERLGAEVRAMADCPDGPRLDGTVDAVGFVYPNYDFQAPAFVQEWLSRAVGLEGTYLFAICTYGISAGGSLQKLDALLRARGAKLSAGFAVIMPHNGIGSSLQPPGVRQALLQRWGERREAIVDIIARRASSDLETESALLGFFRNRSWKMIPGLFRYVGVWLSEGEKGLRYNANDSCNGCGICAKVCPVDNVRVEDQRPRWGSECTNCFGCLHWCPQAAVRLGTKELKIDLSYHHPSVSLNDMVSKMAP